MFSLLNKSDLKKAIETEFESYCTENHLNSNAYDGRYIYTTNLENQDQSKIIYIFDGHADIEERKS